MASSIVDRSMVYFKFGCSNMGGCAIFVNVCYVFSTSY